MKSAHQLIITNQGVINQKYWKILWNRREVLYFLAWRDLLLRYKQTAIGFAWAFIKPILTMLIFSFIFGMVAKLGSSNTPYVLIVFAGLLPWFLFASILVDASNSLISNSPMLKKVYFPRIIFPLSTVLVCFVDFIISLVIFIVLLLWFGEPFTFSFLFFPIFIVATFCLSLGLGFIFAATSVKYRDINQLLPFMIQVGIYISPVGYLTSAVPTHLQFLYSLNPMVGIINGFRWCFLHNLEVTNWFSIIYALIVSVIIFIIGAKVFYKNENTFSDAI